MITIPSSFLSIEMSICLKNVVITQLQGRQAVRTLLIGESRCKILLLVGLEQVVLWIKLY